MGRVIVVTSGKGGVGKTTACANIGCALAKQGKEVLLVDMDLGLRNLDTVLGLENRIVFDIVDVIENKCRIKQAIIRDKRCEHLSFMPASQTRDKNAVNEEQMSVRFCAYRLSRRDRTGIQKCRCRRGRSTCGLHARSFFRSRCGQGYRAYGVKGNCKGIADSQPY